MPLYYFIDILFVYDRSIIQRKANPRVSLGLFISHVQRCRVVVFLQYIERLVYY